VAILGQSRPLTVNQSSPRLHVFPRRGSSVSTTATSVLSTQNADAARTSCHTCLTLQYCNGRRRRRHAHMPIRSLLPHPFTTNVDVKDFQRPGVPVAGTRFIYGAPLFLRRGDTQTPIKLRGWASFIRGWFVGRHAISEHVLRAINECTPKQHSRGQGEWVGG